jgi:eukaryotic translation initiation factor 2C
MRKQVPPDKTNAVLEFATKRPNERLESICHGLSVCSWSALSACLLTIYPKVLEYGESEYVREFGIVVENEPLKIRARVINPPTLRYHQSSKQPSAVCASFFFFSKGEMIPSVYTRDHAMVHGICMSPALAGFVTSQ